ncbi:type II toxin-antitoxin system VapC family toxin [Persephonella sp.]
MNIKKVFVDANVIIDTFDESRKGHREAVEVIRYLLSNKDIELYTSCDLITTVYYVLQKKFGKEAISSIEDALDIYNLIQFSNYEVKESINLIKENSGFKDLEDTLQYVLAKKVVCDLILTNDKNFYSPDIQTITTSQLINKLKEQ